MVTDKQLPANHLARVIVQFLFIIGIILIGFSAPTVAVAQSEVPPTAQAEALAAESGVAVEVVTEMLAAGIPPAYINPEMARQFEREIRPELLLSAPNSSPVDDAPMMISLATTMNWWLIHSCPMPTRRRSCA